MASGASMTGQTHAAHEAITTQIADTQARTALVEVKTLRDIQWREKQRRHSLHNLIIFVFSVSIVVFSVHWHIMDLKRVYKLSFEWWNSPTGYLDNVSAPPPAGRYEKLTIPTASVSATYHPLAKLFSLLFMSADVSRDGALFLLEVTAEFGKSKNLKGVHWNGSPDQLRFNHITTFLPEGPAAYATDGSVNWTYVYSAFNAVSSKDGLAVNPWANTFWQSLDTFVNSPLIKGYYTNDRKSRELMRVMYNGGLCAIAMEYIATSGIDYRDVLFMMLGSQQRPSTKRRCTTADRVSSGISNGSMTAGMLGVMLPMLLPEAEPLMIASSIAFGGATAGVASALSQKDCATTAKGPLA